MLIRGWKVWKFHILRAAVRPRDRPQAGCPVIRLGDGFSGPFLHAFALIAELTWAGASHRKHSVATIAAASCATMNPGASTGRMPANVSLAARAKVTAGLANDVEAVNQYAAVM